MKIRTIFTFSAILVASMLASAQFEIKTNALGLASSNYNGQVELLLNDKSGMEIEASFRQTPWILGISGSEIKNNSLRTMISYKYYVGGEDPTSGLYFGPYLKLKVANMENIPVVVDNAYLGFSPEPVSARVFNTAFFVGLNLGQKIVFNNNLLIEYYGGIGYALSNTRNINDEDYAPDLEDFINVDQNTFTWPLDFRLGISLGYRIWR